MTAPDPQTVREIARQAIRSLIAEQPSAKRYPPRSHIELAMFEHGIDHADLNAWPEVYGAVLTAVGSAQITVSWPDEQPQDERDGDVRAVAALLVAADHVATAPNELASALGRLEARFGSRVRALEARDAKGGKFDG